MRDVASDLATVLAASGLDLATGVNLWIGQMPPEDDGSPDKAVSILQTGGDRPEPFLGGGQRARLKPACQVRVRGDREDYRGAQSLALACLSALNQIHPAPYILISAVESSPFFVGLDNADRPLWTFNIEADYIDDGTTPPALVLDPSGTIAASNVTVAAITGLTADDAQAALAEHQGDIDALQAADSALGTRVTANEGNITSLLASVANAVLLTGAQTIAGIKTFVTTIVAAAGVQGASIFNTTGTVANEKIVKVGTTLADASVVSSARLLSLCTGIGGTEVERFKITKGPGTTNAAAYFGGGGGIGDDSTLRVYFDGTGLSGHVWIVGRFGVDSASIAARITSDRTQPSDSTCASFENATVRKARVLMTGTFEVIDAGAYFAIAKSPNGTRYGVSVANDGTLVTTAL